MRRLISAALTAVMVVGGVSAAGAVTAEPAPGGSTVSDLGEPTSPLPVPRPVGPAPDPEPTADPTTPLPPPRPIEPRPTREPVSPNAECTVDPPIPASVNSGQAYTTYLSNCGSSPFLHIVYADGYDETLLLVAGRADWTPQRRPGTATISADRVALGATNVIVPPATSITLDAPDQLMYAREIAIPITVTGDGVLGGALTVRAELYGTTQVIASTTLDATALEWSGVGTLTWDGPLPDLGGATPVTLTATLGALTTSTTVSVVTPDRPVVTGWVDTTVGTPLNVSVTGVLPDSSALGQEWCDVIPAIDGVPQPAIAAPLAPATLPPDVIYSIAFEWIPPAPGAATFALGANCETADGSVLDSGTITISPRADVTIGLNANHVTAYPRESVLYVSRIANATYGTGPGQCEPILEVGHGGRTWEFPMTYTAGEDVASKTISAGWNADAIGDFDAYALCDLAGTEIRSNDAMVDIINPIQEPTPGTAGAPQTLTVGDYSCVNGTDQVTITYADGFTQTVATPIADGIGAATFTPVVGEITGLRLAICVNGWVWDQPVATPIAFTAPASVQDALDDLARERQAAEDAAADAEQQEQQADATDSEATAQRDLQSALTDEQVARDALTNAENSRQVLIDNEALFAPDDYAQRLVDADAAVDAINAAIDRITDAVGTIRERVAELKDAPQPTDPVSPQSGPAVTAPPAVTDLTATVDGTAVTLSWVGNPQSSQYYIYVDGEQVRRVTAPVTTSTITVPDGPHRVEVRAVNGVGLSAPVGVVVDGQSVQDLQPRQQVQVISSTNITFANGAYKLSKRGHKQVKAIAKRYQRTVRAGETPAIVVHAFAGKDAGKPGTRIDDRRAHTIRQGLIRAGVPADRIDVVGGGVNGDREIAKGRYANVLVYEAD